MSAPADWAKVAETLRELPEWTQDDPTAPEFEDIEQAAKLCAAMPLVNELLAHLDKSHHPNKTKQRNLVAAIREAIK